MVIVLLRHFKHFKQNQDFTSFPRQAIIAAVQLTVFQLIINGNKFVTFNRTNRLITALISDPFHSLQVLHLILIFRGLQSRSDCC